MALKTEVTGAGKLTGRDKTNKEIRVPSFGGTMQVYRETTTSETRMWEALTESAAQTAYDAETANNKSPRMVLTNPIINAWAYEVTTSAVTLTNITP